MQGQIQATFNHAEDAEMAIAALRGLGAIERDLTVLHSQDLSVNEQARDAPPQVVPGSIVGAASVGAIWGLVVGIVVGCLLAAGDLFVPGIGLVTGRRADATAILGIIATTTAGAVFGAVIGYLKDLRAPGMEQQDLFKVLKGGGAVIYLDVPSGEVDSAKAGEIILRYDGVAQMKPKAKKAYLA